MRAPSKVGPRSAGRRRGDGAPVGRSTEVEVPVPPRALQLLARADGELVAAQMSGQDWERFWHAHLAGVRAGAGLRAAVEAGRLELVTAARADEALSVALGMVEAVRVALGRSAPVPAMRAS